VSTFTEFVAKYNTGSIVGDAAWRAYDIEGMAKPKHAEAALPLVGYNKSRKRHPFHAVAGYYGIGTAARAEYLLGLWYVWRAIAMGDTKRATLRETDG